MANTFELIASATAGSGGSASFDFGSIPATFTDLLIDISTRDTATNVGSELKIRFNSDTGANYNWRRIYGDGGTVYSQSGSGIGAPYTSFVLAGYSSGASTTSNTFGSTLIYIPNYLSSNYKSISSDSVSENNAAGAYQALTAGIWNNTSAINAISIFGLSFVQYSTAYLYGVKSS